MSADPDEGGLLDLASSIDENRPVDWNAAERAAGDASRRAVVSELRVLAGMTGVFRDPNSRRTATSVGHDAGERIPSDATWSWGSLTVLEEIGAGAFGTVYRARDNLNRDVALKLFTAGDQVSLTARMLREGRLLARVRHPNVVVVYGADRFEGRVGLWMEFIRGRTLENELRTRGVFSAQEAGLIGLAVCRALAAVHDAGLLHCDVKAQNVMRENGGRIVLMDFGAGADATVRGVGTADVAGTPSYLAPEVFAGEPASRSSDIYSVGVLLYHLVTGSYPVAGSHVGQIQHAHQAGRYNRLRDVRPDLPEGFVQVVESALVPDPRLRYQTAGQFERDLVASCGLGERPDPLLPPAPKPRWVRSWLTITLFAAMVAFGIAGLAYVQRSRPQMVNAGAVRPSVQSPLPAPVSSADAAYTVTAVFYRYTSGAPARLAPADRVRPGDALGLRLEATIPVYVYVVNEDDRGESYLLFPLPGQESVNPLSAATVHELPGAHAGQDVQWQVTSAGGREHFLVFVSPSHITLFDGLLKSLPRPNTGRQVSKPRLSDSLVSRLRGVGGLVPRNPRAKPSEAHYLFEGARPLGTQPETAHGVWVRQLTLENPG